MSSCLSFVESDFRLCVMHWQATHCRSHFTVKHLSDSGGCKICVLVKPIWMGTLDVQTEEIIIMVLPAVICKVNTYNCSYSGLIFPEAWDQFFFVCKCVSRKASNLSPPPSLSHTHTHKHMYTDTFNPSRGQKGSQVSDSESVPSIRQ